jgi:hypothetical protein
MRLLVRRAFVAAASVCFAAPRVAAQTCWRGRQLPECRRFWITESGPRFGNHEALAGGHMGSANALGLMVNRSPGVALGGTLELTTGSETGTYRLALMPPYRRWIGSALALDLGLGVAFLGEGTQAAGFKGVSAFAALNHRDLVAVTAELESRRGTSFGTQTVTTVGIRFGAYLGAIVAVASAAWGVVVATGAGP